MKWMSGYWLMWAVVMLAVGTAVGSGQELLWESKLGFTGVGPIAVSGGVVVTGNTTANKGTVGLDEQTGKLLWRLPGQMKNGPAADGSHAYTISLVSGDNYRLTAADLKTGKVVWTFEARGLGSTTDLRADGGRVYVAGDDGVARAFDAVTGKLLWEFRYSPGKGMCPTTITQSGGFVYFGGGEENYAKSQGVFLWALDAATGKEAWRFAAKPETWSRIGECVTAPAVSDGVVAVAGAHIVYGLDARTGAEKWKQQVMRQVEGRLRARNLSAPHIMGGMVYAMFEEGLGGWALKTGAPAFEFAGRFPPDQDTRSIASADGILYFTSNFETPEMQGNRQGFLYALDPATKQIRWKHRVNRPSQYNDPAVWPTSCFALGEGAVYYENYGFVAKVKR